MLKKLFVVFILFVSPVFAGVYEDALAKSNNVFLYLYTPECRTCNMFNPVYDSLRKIYKDYEFVKVDASQRYGYGLMMKFKGNYVPYIIITNKKKNKNASVGLSCVLNEMCIDRTLNNFKS